MVPSYDSGMEVIMKRIKSICVILLCLCLILTGCQNNKGRDQQEKIGTNSKTEDNSELVKKPTVTPFPTNSSEASEPVNSGMLYLDNDWTVGRTMKPFKSSYTALETEANVAGYKIAGDLSNVENIDQFSGLTKEQQKLLVKNGFVVLPTTNTKMYYTYDGNEYSGVPNFITSDSVLHLYHLFYDKSLMNVETSYLYEDLDLLTKQMLGNSLLLLAQLKDEKLIELQKDNVVYFLVARMLMLNSTEVPVEVDNELLTLARQEYQLATEAKEMTESPLIKSKVDYTMFTVRGHYTRSEELGRFFRTMMWFGILPYNFFDFEGVYQYENVLRSLLISYTTFAKNDTACNAELWSNIYLPTSEYVGVSDDINVFTMNELRQKVFQDVTNPDIFNDDVYYDALLAAVKALPDPEIQGKLTVQEVATGKQFRFMGQRYVLDSDILQDLVEPILRELPSALDLMGVLGSKTAEDLQKNVYQPQKAWPEYTGNYVNWKEAVSALTPDYWGTNLYTGWLWTLQEALKEYTVGSGMPFFMMNDAWSKKSLNTAIGSYTELKHDTVLYGKQAMAEAGGPVEFAKSHYVEPKVELYGKLYYLTNYTVTALKERGMLNEKILAGAEEYKELLQLLISCSTKELKNEPLSDEENKELLRYGGTLEKISSSLLNGITDAQEDYPNIEISDMLVTDIATGAGQYLSLGTGYFDDIYVVAPMLGKLYLCRGSVYSSYEFTSSKRLTDEEWWAYNGISIDHEDYGDFAQIGEPSADLPLQQDWVKTFKSDTNQVTVKVLEVDFDNLED